MIARILIPILLAVLLTDLYIDRRFIRRRCSSRWKRCLWLLPSVAIYILSFLLASEKSFVPADVLYIHLYLLLLGVYLLPRLLFVVCSAVGWGIRVMAGKKDNWGNLVGFAVAVTCVVMVVYGATIGWRNLQVKHVHLTFSQLPPAFDGYRIVHFSDFHAGTFAAPLRDFVEEAVDSMLAQQADLICFTGDIQNVRPEELRPVAYLLSALSAKDGVCSVMGNHDYSMYLHADSATRAASEQATAKAEEAMGWLVLRNSHRVIHRGNDSIFVVGTENDGQPPFPSKANWQQALAGVPQGAFTLVLQHDPSAWRRNVLPHTQAALTLSGHTHGGQFGLFGWRPTQWRYAEDLGLYSHSEKEAEEPRYLYITAGLGGVVPFRLGVNPEITVITLHSAKQ